MDDLIDTIKSLDLDPDEPIYIHRGPDGVNHVEDDCWCYPLELTITDLHVYTEAELREMLEAFLSLH